MICWYFWIQNMHFSLKFGKAQFLVNGKNISFLEGPRNSSRSVQLLKGSLNGTRDSMDQGKSNKMLKCMVNLKNFPYNTIPETNVAPARKPFQRKVVFQPSIFRCYVSPYNVPVVVLWIIFYLYPRSLGEMIQFFIASFFNCCLVWVGVIFHGPCWLSTRRFTCYPSPSSSRKLCSSVRNMMCRSPRRWLNAWRLKSAMATAWWGWWWSKMSSPKSSCLVDKKGWP